jgi:hypothetical protein
MVLFVYEYDLDFYATATSNQFTKFYNLDIFSQLYFLYYAYELGHLP